MTTTEQFGGAVPPPPPPPGRPEQNQRVLRRSREDRVAAGVAGGLGEYFGVDPVLFRVLIATAAFFGGAGVLAYLVAWAAIPEHGTVSAPIDRFVAGLRRRRIPVWLVAIAAGLVLWAVAFSWWAPHRFFPLIAVVIVLVAVFGRRARRQDMTPDVSPSPADATVRLDKPAGPPGTAPIGPVADPATSQSNRPAWVDETRQWISEAKQASRERRRRSWPVRITMLCALVGTFVVLGIADGVDGIPIPTYFWALFGITLAGLLVGMVLRRTPWSMVSLLVPAVIGVIAFAPTSASLHDGNGQRDWTPTNVSELQSRYTLAFGQGVLDLTHLGPLPEARTVHIRLAGGQVKVLIPPTLDVVVHAKVHIGDIEVDSDQPAADGTDWHNHGGWGLDRTVVAPAGATGQQLTVEVDVADGNVSVQHQG